MLIGCAPLDELVPDRATMTSFSTEPVALPGATVVQAFAEIAVAGRERALPSGLHPTNPPSAVVQVWSCPESQWGPFALAQGRVACRSGLRPRGMVQGCVVDNAEAADALRARWGLPAVVGEVELRRGYDEVVAAARVGGREVLTLTGRDPDPLGLGDVAYTTTVTLAETRRGPRLVQVDLGVAPTRAERLRPHLVTLAPGWLHPSVVVSSPVSASVAVADLTLQRLRYASRPEELAFTGTEPLDEG